MHHYYKLNFNYKIMLEIILVFTRFVVKYCNSNYYMY